MDFYESVLRTVSALAVVLALMVLLAWVLRRFGRTVWMGTGQPPLIQVVATTSLGPRKAVSLVSVGDEMLIVGSSANELVDLGRVRDPARVLEKVRARQSNRDVTASVPGCLRIDATHD